MTTIGTMLKGLSTLDQLEVLQRADVMFRDRAGRYYGGPVTEEQVIALMPVKRA